MNGTEEIGTATALSMGIFERGLETIWESVSDAHESVQVCTN